ncbi:MAG: AAA family ATPase [Prolixibacteraceae bacterium]|nr:AAA family ATPase [Prolixibacteraceae bacterium]MBN2775585.1 AAA family ATPase [Prolixibacteraceae bacterium]
MIKNHIHSVLTEQLSFLPTESQVRLLKKLAEFISSPEEDEIFIIKGFAGTGKTSMVALLVKALLKFKIKSVLLAPTGRAAKVLSSYAGIQAFTIHKKIYRQKSSSDGMGKFVLDKNLYKNTFFIVDEASMISNQSFETSNFGSGRLLDDLVEYVYSGQNCRLILVGDTAQLPPVGLNISPALEIFELEQYGFGADEIVLTDVVRQSENSGILVNATQIRQLISDEENFNGFFPVTLENFDDIQRISGGELIEKISECYDKYGIFETSVVTRSNKRANLYNKGIRKTILYREDEISKGDLLMVVKNNYFWMGENEEMDFIANGDIAEIESIYRYEELYGFRFADVRLRFIDYKDVEFDCKIFLDTIELETASLTSEDSGRLYQAVSEDYMEIKNKRKRWEKIKDNPYYNALQVKFAYAVTCHKAQGGQWKSVFIDQGYLTEEMIDKEFLRWLYTAFTRPTEKLFLVNFSDRFFE